MTDYTTIDVGVGWRTPVENLLRALPHNVKVAQIKEKFGGLRVYIDYEKGVDSIEVEKLIDKAVTMCETICETCGKKGELLSRGWWKTTCWPCALNSGSPNQAIWCHPGLPNTYFE